MKGCRIIACRGIVECISTYILVAIEEERNRRIVIVVTGEEAIREILGCIKEVSIKGIGIGRKIEGIETVIWNTSENCCAIPYEQNLCLCLRAKAKR